MSMLYLFSAGFCQCLLEDVEEMKSDIASILKQFEPIEKLYRELDAMSDHSDQWLREEVFAIQCLSCIERLMGLNSTYGKRAQRALNMAFRRDPDDKGASGKARLLFAVMEALRSDIENGGLFSVRELVRADMFSDFLETAEYFLEEGYKDPAAVMIGGVLEGHLRNLCRKNGIDTEDRSRGNPRPKKAEDMNVDLARNGCVYSNIHRQQVTAWLAIRNKAAHADYGAYDEQQVRLLLDGVRDFVSKYPA